MSEELIKTLSLTLVITSVLTVETRRLSFAVLAYLVQALIIVALLLCFATINPALYWWAGTALATKSILTPLFLFWGISGSERLEVKPVIGFGPSSILAVLLMLGFYRMTHVHWDLLASGAQALQEVFRTNLAVAATIFVLGLYCVLTRRDAIKTVIGLCLLENGVHLGLVSMAPDLPETALFGVATEMVVTVFLLLIVIKGVRRTFGTTDTFKLKELQW